MCVCVSHILTGKYLKREVVNLARFISVMKARSLTWRVAHPYVLADRMEVRGTHIHTYTHHTLANA